MSDIIREVDEELRRERLQKFWARWGHWVLAAIAVIVVGTAAGVWWQNWTAQRAVARSMALEAALSEAEIAAPEAGFERLTAFARAHGGGAGYLARLHAAGRATQAGDSQAAVEALDAAAAQPGLSPLFRDMAALMAAYRVVDSAPVAAVESRIQTLQDGHPAWRHHSRALAARLAARQGAHGRAATLYETLAADPETRNLHSLRDRARRLAAFHRGRAGADADGGATE